ncbi:4Fe-4S dicluster domain-containing protein [Thermodesulfobacteriota bacterium]
MKKMLFVDADKCVACRTCELACSFAKTSVLDPLRSRITNFNFPGTPFRTSTTCQQCEEPACAVICPSRALSRDPITGAILVDKERCVGCKMCMQVCPFGTIHLDSEERIAVKCDLCGGDPVCVKFCIPGALQYIEVKDVVRQRGKRFVDKLRKVYQEGSL